MAKNNNIWKRLTRTFRTGNVTRRKVRNYKFPSASTALEAFRKNNNFVSNVLSGFGSYDRMCVDLDTKIAVPGPEEFISLRELIEKYPNGEKFLVYAYDHNSKKITPAWAHHPRISGEFETLKITFDDNSTLICTGNHPCLKRNGEYVDADKLEVGDSMMYYQGEGNSIIAKIESYKKIPVGDLTVEGHENFATDSIIVHNSRYADMSEMTSTPEISSALSIYAAETVAKDENKIRLHIYSENSKIKQALQELFYDILNVNVNLYSWTHALCKYGDFFMLNDISPEYGIIGAYPIPVNELEREEGYDPNNPLAMRYRWASQGNIILQNWQVSHFRLLEDDAYLPYGTSVLDGARRIWRQLCLSSDSKVWTPQGHKKITDIKIGDEVYSFDHVQNKICTTKVRNHRKTGIKNTVHVKTNHRDLYVTDDHELLTYNPKTKEYSYEQVKNIKVNKKDSIQRLVLPTIRNQNIAPHKIFLDKENYSVKLTEQGKLNLKPQLGNGILEKIRLCGCDNSDKNVHAFLSGYGNRRVKYSDFEKLKELFKFDKNDFDLFYRGSKNKSILDKEDFSFTVDEKFCKIFGFMLGDGWIDRRGDVGFALGEYDDQNQYYQNLFESYGFKSLETPPKSNSRGGQFKIYSNELANIFKEAGFKTGCFNKRIPEWLFNSSLENKIALIRGLHDADGSNSDKRIWSSNKNLINDLYELALSCNLKTGRISKTKKKEKRIINGRKVKSQNSHRLYVDIPKNIDDVLYEKIISVELYKENEEVWDIEVDNELHNFIADGVVVHNCMLEDAMMVYRIVRSPERRVFKIDISNVEEKDVEQYIEQVRATLKTNSVVDPSEGRLDLRFDPMSVDQDYFLGIREGSQTTVDTLAGGQHVSAVEDVEYLQNKLFGALKVPKAYLNYAEDSKSKANLSQQDIQFSRIIERIQETIVAELNKLAMIHLMVIGFEGEDLVDFDLRLSNPSTIAEQQRLEVIRQRLDIAQGQEGFNVSKDYIRKNIFRMTDEEISLEEKNLLKDRIRQLRSQELKTGDSIDDEGFEGVGGFDDDMIGGGEPLKASLQHDQNIKIISEIAKENPEKNIDKLIDLVEAIDFEIDSRNNMSYKDLLDFKKSEMFLESIDSFLNKKSFMLLETDWSELSPQDKRKYQRTRNKKRRIGTKVDFARMTGGKKDPNYKYNDLSHPDVYDQYYSKDPGGSSDLKPENDLKISYALEKVMEEEMNKGPIIFPNFIGKDIRYTLLEMKFGLGSPESSINFKKAMQGINNILNKDNQG